MMWAVPNGQEKNKCNGGGGRGPCVREGRECSKVPRESRSLAKPADDKRKESVVAKRGEERSFQFSSPEAPKADPSERRWGRPRYGRKKTQEGLGSEERITCAHNDPCFLAY